jgi:hypothetical protein
MELISVGKMSRGTNVIGKCHAALMVVGKMSLGTNISRENAS